jgi:hypothetical protein
VSDDSSHGAARPTDGAAASHADTLGAATRILAWAGFGAVLFANLVVTGLRSVAGQRTVETSERIGTTLSYLLALLAAAFIFRAAYELIKPQRMAVLPRFIVAGLAVIGCALASPALGTRLPQPIAVGIVVLTCAMALASSFLAVRALHTRAAGLVVGILAITGLLRMIAWYSLTRGVEDANPSRYGLGLSLATGAAIGEALAYLVAALWLATRGGPSGKVLVNVALALAIFLTWTSGGAPTDTGFRSVVQTAMAEAVASGLPTASPTLTHFLVAASIFLGGAFVAQRRQAPLVVGALALSIFSRGMLDVPLRSFMMVAGSIGLVLAASDERTMWTQLLATRKEPAAN